MKERTNDHVIVVLVFVATTNVILLFCLYGSDHEYTAYEQYQQAGQDDNSCLQCPDKSARVLNLDEVLDHRLPVHFTLYCFHCLTGVNARLRIGRSDDESQAQYSVSGTWKEDAVREAPADWEVCFRGTWKELRYPDVQVDNGMFLFH